MQFSRERTGESVHITHLCGYRCIADFGPRDVEGRRATRSSGRCATAQLMRSGPSVNTSNPIAGGSLDTGHSQDRLTRTVGPVQSGRSGDRGGGMDSPPLPLAHTNATSRAPGLQNPVCVGRRNPARAREWDPLTARASRQQSCQVQKVAEERILVTSQERRASRSCLSPGGRDSRPIL